MTFYYSIAITTYPSKIHQDKDTTIETDEKKLAGLIQRMDKIVIYPPLPHNRLRRTKK